MHRCRHGKAPQNLVYCCTPVTNVDGRQRFRSATQQLMVVPRHRLSTVGRCQFTVYGPIVWNSLPDDLRPQQGYESFRQGLKPGFSPDTSVLSALETFVIIALYESTFTIPYHTMMMCRRQDGTAPQYLTAHWTPVSQTASRQHLRSAVSHQLTVPPHRRVTYGGQAFTVVGPSTWNSLLKRLYMRPF